MKPLDILKNNELFKALDEDELMSVAELTTRKSVLKNTVIISEGDFSAAMYLIVKGKVNVSVMNEEGEELILATLQQGDNFGELSLLDDQPRSANVIALEDSVFMVLQKIDFYPLMKQNSKIAMGVIQYLCKRVRLLTGTAHGLALLDVYGRVVKLLHDLAAPAENGQLIISQVLTHQDIASRVGSSREMVSHILNDLKKGHYLTIENKIITIQKKLPSAW
jgi:CRP/FNR family cyclic AMP-dependent transcriptional regulator